MVDTLISITRENCGERISQVVGNNKKICFRRITRPNLSYCIKNSANLDELKVKLEEKGLLNEFDRDQLNAKDSAFKKWEYLYCEVLNKRVTRQEHYVTLFKALHDTLNGHIVETLFTTLTNECRQSSQPATLQTKGTITATTKVILSCAAVVVTIGLASVLVGFLVLINTSSSQSKPFTAVSEVNHNHVAPELQVPKPLPDGKPEEQPSNSTLPSKSDVTTHLPEFNVKDEVHQDPSQSAPTSTETIPETLVTLTPNNKFNLEIRSPTDMKHFPGGIEIDLTLNNSNGTHNQWIEWFPQNASQVTSLTLVGVFTSLQLWHFLFVMKNVTSLNIESLTGKICEKYIRGTALKYENLQHLQITHVKNQQCGSAYKFLTDRFEFPNLKSVEIVNLPIMQENEEFVVKFFTKYQSQLTHIEIRNVVVHLKSQPFGNIVFKNLTSLYSEFRYPNFEGAKSVFVNLNRATPNLEEINSNVLCTPDEKCIFGKNWPKINGKKKMLCDVHGVLNSLPSTC